MYTITFTDNTKYEGGFDLTNSGWNEMPQKNIKSIEYKLVGPDILLHNHEMYNHLVEFAVMGGMTLPIAVILMGKTGENVTCIKYDFVKKQLIREIKLYGKEYNSGITTGWHVGIGG